MRGSGSFSHVFDCPNAPIQPAAQGAGEGFLLSRSMNSSAWARLRAILARWRTAFSRNSAILSVRSDAGSGVSLEARMLRTSAISSSENPRGKKAETDAEHELGEWLPAQRFKLGRGTLSAEKAAALDAAVPGWRAGRKRGGKSGKTTMIKRHSDVVLEITAHDPNTVENDLNAAVEIAREHAMKECRDGILVTQHGYTNYTVAVSREVPYGQTHKRREEPANAQTEAGPASILSPLSHGQNPRRWAEKGMDWPTAPTLHVPVNNLCRSGSCDASDRSSLVPAVCQHQDSRARAPGAYGKCSGTRLSCSRKTACWAPSIRGHRQCCR